VSQTLDTWNAYVILVINIFCLYISSLVYITKTWKDIWAKLYLNLKVFFFNLKPGLKMKYDSELSENL